MEDLTNSKLAVDLPSDHQLWVNLTSFGDGNIFSIWTQMLENMLVSGIELADEYVDVIFPSDEKWQTKIYYQLVEKQRFLDAANKDENEEAMLDPLLRNNELKEPVKLHDWDIGPKNKKKEQCEIRVESLEDQRHGKCKGLLPITWTVSDIAKAGGLLRTPPLNISFEDEQEMRRVYTLIYDVFRYKCVLTQALNDVSFFQTFPQLEKCLSIVWLLFYDLYHRSFKKRETTVLPLATKLFDSVGLSFTENALWTQRVKLAAAVSRLRIKRNALCLSELLPEHLKDEKVTAKAKKTPVTCWVNSAKVEDSLELCKKMEETLSLKLVEDERKLNENEFKIDKHCPNIVSFHSSMRTVLARSEFVRNRLLIVQDRSFCLGAATFDKILVDLELTGSVIQTHINSPRTTAYLANLLTQNEKIKRLMAFSAGQRKIEYESYFTELGMRNVIIYSDRLIDFPPDSNFMEEVVAIFATPPNSYSAVTDPIDLVCSRGGDLSMLEVLTESELTKEGSERVTMILDEQKKTLKFAMSRPQIQFVLYETHSEIEAENDVMVNKTLKDINRLAKIHHAALQGKIATPISQESCDTPIVLPTSQYMIEIKEPKEEPSEQPKIEEEPNKIIPEKRNSLTPKNVENDEVFLDKIQVPDTDLFDLPKINSLCPSETACMNVKKEGCYLALLQRKEIIRLDDKYMIQMAENRGLFGSNTAATSKSKSSRTSRRKQEKAKQTDKPKKRLESMEIDRIAAPTHTFLRHIKPTEDVETCKRCLHDDENNNKQSQYRRWWTEATRHVVSLRKCLEKHKVVPCQKMRRVNKKNVINCLLSGRMKVDEIASKSNSTSRFPIFPKLKLSRDRQPWVKSISEESIVESSSSNEEDYEDSETIEQLENEFEYSKDVAIETNSSGLKNILGRLTSAHIRRLISPFFKDRDYSPMWLPSLYRKRILEEKSGYEITKKKLPNKVPVAPKIASSSLPTNEVEKKQIKQISRNSVISRSPKKSRKSSRNSVTSDRPRIKKKLSKKKQDRLFERLCIPTQCCIMRNIAIESEMDGRCGYDNEKRIFYCTQCKKRNIV